jgi:hypothetical protein
MFVRVWISIQNLLRILVNWSCHFDGWQNNKYNQKLIPRASMLSSFLWNTYLFWTSGAWYKSPIIMTSIFPKVVMCMLNGFKTKIDKRNILLPIRETLSNLYLEKFEHCVISCSHAFNTNYWRTTPKKRVVSKKEIGENKNKKLFVPKFLE